MPSTEQCRIIAIKKLSDDVLSFELESLNHPFADLEPGAHLDVYMKNSMIRQYSVWDWSEDKRTLSIAVKREDNGAGGSICMHQQELGDLLTISSPRNNFVLHPDAPHYTLVAGGIGVTPIYSMANFLRKNGAKFSIYYLVQQPSLAAFQGKFEALKLGDNYRLHCDNEEGLFDFNRLLDHIPSNSHIYTCGPEPMLSAIMKAAPNHRLVFERFSAASNAMAKPNQIFEIKINSTGAIYSVGVDESILSVLTENGLHVDSGCTEGVCGSCVTDVLEGRIDHRDEIFSDDEKESNEFMCICVSRAKSNQLVLDL